jgi:hypothetical protein
MPHRPPFSSFPFCLCPLSLVVECSNPTAPFLCSPVTSHGGDLALSTPPSRRERHPIPPRPASLFRCVFSIILSSFSASLTIALCLSTSSVRNPIIRARTRGRSLIARAQIAPSRASKSSSQVSRNSRGLCQSTRPRAWRFRLVTLAFVSSAWSPTRTADGDHVL